MMTFAPWGDHVLDLIVLELGFMVGFLNENFVTGILEQLGHLVAFARPTLGGEVGEGKPTWDWRQP